jgi:hypothetical protein
MSRGGKTFKDQKEQRALKHEREPRPLERGGHKNLVREALEEAAPHNDLTLEELEKVEKFLKGLGPYQADLWSNSYYSQILEHIESIEEEKKDE